MRHGKRHIATRVLLIVMSLVSGHMGQAVASEPLVIAASPSLAVPLDALGRPFEATHPGVKVQLYYGSGLELRQTIAALENRD